MSSRENSPYQKALRAFYDDEEWSPDSQPNILKPIGPLPDEVIRQGLGATASIDQRMNTLGIMGFGDDILSQYFDVDSRTLRRWRNLESLPHRPNFYKLDFLRLAVHTLVFVAGRAPESVAELVVGDSPPELGSSYDSILDGLRHDPNSTASQVYVFSLQESRAA